MPLLEGLRYTRSGKIFSPFRAVSCPSKCEFRPMLEESLRQQEEIISAYSDSEDSSTELNTNAHEVLHDIPEVLQAYLDWDNTGSMLNPLHDQPCQLVALAEHRLIESLPAITLAQSFAGANANKASEVPKKKLYYKQRRKYKRQEEKAMRGQLLQPDIEEKYIGSAKCVKVSADFSSFIPTLGAYTAISNRKATGTKVNHQVVNLQKNKGFEVLEWDAEEDCVVVDKNNIVTVALVAIPKDPSYRSATKCAFHHIYNKGHCEQFSHSECNHPRGAFPAINIGVTHGKGTIQPVNLDNHDHSPMVKRLLADEDIQRMAGFASASFAMWSPKVYSYYKEHLDKLYKERPALRRNFHNSMFPCTTFNFGPQVRTYAHCDAMNCPFGWCAVQALGDYNHKMGGHLILWELKLIVEFPPGSLILLPSALITHSNIAMSENETHLSFTQFAAGGLFRYVDYGFQTRSQLQAQDPAKFQKILEERPHQWEKGIALMRKLPEVTVKIVS